MAHGIKVWDKNKSIELAEWPEQDCFKANDYLTADKMNTALRNATIGIKLLFDAIDTSNIKVDYKLTSDEYVSQVAEIKNALASASSGNSATTSTRGTIMLGYTPTSIYQYALNTDSDGKAYVDLSRNGGIIYTLNNTVNAATSEKTADTIVKRDSNGAAKLDITGNASTATTLSTARTIITDLASTSTASFDGSGNITPGVSGILPVANGGTGQSSLDNVVVGKAKKINTSAAIGAINKPVYINSDGTVQPCSYGLNTTVPSNAVFTDTTYSVATTSANGLMSSTDKSKLDGIANNANNYSLPVASSSALGGIKSQKTGTTGGRDYKVEVDSSGNAKVNVPWTDHYAWSDITSKPSTFTPSSHKHTKLDIINLVVFNGTGSYTLNGSGVYLIWNSNSSGDITISSKYKSVTVKGIALAIFRASAEGDFINIIGATDNTMDHLGTDNGININVKTTTKIYKLIGLGDQV